MNNLIRYQLRRARLNDLQKCTFLKEAGRALCHMISHETCLVPQLYSARRRSHENFGFPNKTLVPYFGTYSGWGSSADHLSQAHERTHESFSWQVAVKLGMGLPVSRDPGEFVDESGTHPPDTFLPVSFLNGMWQESFDLITKHWHLVTSTVDELALLYEGRVRDVKLLQAGVLRGLGRFEDAEALLADQSAAPVAASQAAMVSAS